MAITVADLLTSIAYRRGEASSPDNATERSRRISFLNEAYRAVLQKNYYWFTVKTDTDSSVADQETYDLPSDFRKMIEVRIDDIVRYPVPDYEAFDYYRYPPIAFAYKYDYDNKYYYTFGSEIHFLPETPDDGSDNIQYRYFYWPTDLTSTTDTVVIPDQYTEALVAYAFARLAHLRGKRGDASDGFEEFNEIVREMNKENMRRSVAGNSVTPGDFKYTGR
jgi:hypothetical protein